MASHSIKNTILRAVIATALLIITKGDIMGREALKQRLEKYEGRKHEMYHLNGIAHIGIGRNLESGVKLSDRVIDMILEDDIQVAVDSLKKVFPEFGLFTTKRQDALIDMMFNLGEPTFRKFKNMIEAIKDNRWDEAASHVLDSRAAKQLPERYREIAEDMTVQNQDGEFLFTGE